MSWSPDSRKIRLAKYIAYTVCKFMQIYSKSTKNATSLSFLGRFWFCLFYLIGLVQASKLLHRILKFINYANLCKFIENNEKCYFSVISWPILILFVLSDRAWCGLQNFYTEFWNSLIMQIYSKSTKNATSLSFLGRFWFCLFYLIGLGAGFKTSTQNFDIH